MNELVKQHIKERVAGLPKSPGVYLMKDEHGKIIYIGKAKVLKNRVSSYFIDTQKAPKVSQMVSHVNTFDYIITNTELEALNLESNLVKLHQPYYNILLKDGKGHPYLKIDLNDDYPNIAITRKLKKDGAKYFGPYFGAIYIKDLLKVINAAFQIRTCEENLNNGRQLKRECLNFHIKQCSAPCVRKVSKEEYRAEVERVIHFLNGDLTAAKTILTEKMNACVQTENFERAIEYRESLNLVTYLNSKLLTQLTKPMDIDVFGYATNGVASIISVLVIRAGKIMGITHFYINDISTSRGEIMDSFVTQYYPANSTLPDEVVLPDSSGENDLTDYLKQFKQKTVVVLPKQGFRKELIKMAEVNAAEYLEKNTEKSKQEEQKTIGAIKRLKEVLGLKRLPFRIEGFDISHLGGTDTVAAMVVFINGKPYNSHYRKFKIKSVAGIDDYASMKETLSRRMGELSGSDESFKNPPDLILIDGGKGQLSFANSVLTNLNSNLDIISLAEKNELVFKPNREEPFLLSKTDYALKLLQNVRDEAHRFAITYNRSKRIKSNLQSELTKIKGVGPETCKKIIAHFRDIGKIKNATLQALLEVEGLKSNQAQAVYEYYNKK